MVMGFILSISLLVWMIAALCALEEAVPIKICMKIQRFWRKSYNRFFILLILGAIAVGYIGYLGLSSKDEKSLWYLLAPELIGSAIIILTIDLISYCRDQAKAADELKDTVIKNLGSHDNKTALDALTEIRNRRWLTDGSLEGIHFHESDLTEAYLWGIKLHKSTLISSKLTQAKLNRSHIYETDFFSVDMEQINLSSAWLKQVEFHNLSMIGAIFIKASLNNVRFNNVDLSKSQFMKAVLNKVDFSTAKLNDVSLLGATYDDKTLWPENMHMPQATKGESITIDIQLLKSIRNKVN